MKIELSSEDNAKAEFTLSLVEPSDDMQVIQVLTYPNLLLKVRDEGKEIKFNGIDALVPQDEGQEHGYEILMYEFIEGVLIGRIDNNFVEIEVITEGQLPERMLTDGKASFMIDDSARECIEALVDGQRIEFAFYERENGTLLITEAKASDMGLIRVSGLYVGRVDSNYIEVKIDQEFTVFKFREDSTAGSTVQLEDNSNIIIEYFINDDDQKEIASIDIQE